MLVVGLTADGPFAAELKAKPELSAVIDSADGIDQLSKFLIVAVYGTVAVLNGVFQGLNAFYYFTRRKHVIAYVNNTPAWVLDLQRITSQT